MKVSVVIPCYNHGKYVEEAIKSVLDSTYENIEIIVVNDGSTCEDTISILKDLEIKYKDIVFIHQSNKGLPGARNSGIRVSTGEYILPLDADDLIAPTFIEKAVWVLIRKPEISLVYSNVQLFGKENYVWYTKDFSFNELLIDNYIPATALFRKKIWEQLDGYDESFAKGYEDWEFWLRIASNGFKGYKINEVLFFYRKHEVSMLSESNKKRKELIKKIREKYPRKLQIHLINDESLRIKTKRIASILMKRIYRKLPNKAKLIIKKAYYSTYNKSSSIRFETTIFDNLIKDYSSTPISESNKKEKINVMFILPWLNLGGVERVYLELIENLTNKVNFIFVTTKQSDHPWANEFLKHTKKIYHIDKLSGNEVDQMIFVLDLIKKYNINIVQISNSLLGNKLTPSIKKYYPKTLVINHLHMEEPYEPWDYFRVSTKFEQFVDHFVVLTTKQKQALENRYGIPSNKINIIPNGINSAWLKNSNLKSEESKINIAFIGRLDDQKQPLLFLKIIKCLLKSRNKHKINKVKLVGTGPLLMRVKSNILRNGLAGKIDLITNLNSEGIKKIMHEGEVNILILPSKIEGLPIVGLEAMASRVLLVVSNVDGWNDLVTNKITGILVDDFDTKKYVEMIDYLINDPKLKETILVNAQKLVVDKYTSDIMSERYYSLYSSIIKKNDVT
ncbi:glycosyltransferase [Paenibacillus ehimensis]|uniref:glycosyltransferase n=1 Tax=Paenibacillus ehimensis TaxID=79264 RepID=UPI002DBA9E3A|nr:glycosyltransferase [Paenibacillus ehimensis]MEC0213249.1 glycosyltransferase [Paenibacillus ehimensis]